MARSGGIIFIFIGFSVANIALASDLPRCPASGYFHNCFGTYAAAGNQYVGEFRHDKRHGYGAYTSASGTKYIGDWENGKRSGQGTLTYEGFVYSGGWKNNLFHGHGELTFGPFSPNAGDKYVGEFSKGQKHGRGRYIYSDGFVQEGEWVNDMFKKT